MILNKLLERFKNFGSGDDKTMDPAKEQEVSLEKCNEDSRSNSDNSRTLEIPTNMEPEFLTGNQASLLIFSIAMAGLLYSLDVTIIVTVSASYWKTHIW